MWFKLSDTIVGRWVTSATNRHLQVLLNRFASKHCGSGYAFLTGDGFGDGVNYMHGDGKGGGVGSGMGDAIPNPCLITQIAVNELIGGEDVVA